MTNLKAVKLKIYVGMLLYLSAISPNKMFAKFMIPRMTPNCQLDFTFLKSVIAIPYCSRPLSNPGAVNLIDKNIKQMIKLPMHCIIWS